MKPRFPSPDFIAALVLLVFIAFLMVRLAHAETPKQPPLAAIAVSQCGLAVALFVQLDATHLFRADPRQSDLFVATPDGMHQQAAGAMKWEDALELARSAAIQTHVTLPCTDGPAT